MGKRVAHAANAVSSIEVGYAFLGQYSLGRHCLLERDE